MLGIVAVSASLKRARSATSLLEVDASLISFGMPSSRRKFFTPSPQNWKMVRTQLIHSFHVNWCANTYALAYPCHVSIHLRSTSRKILFLCGVNTFLAVYMLFCFVFAILARHSKKCM